MLTTPPPLAPKALSLAQTVGSTVATIAKTAVANPISTVTITETVRPTPHTMSIAAATIGMSATPSLRSIVPRTLLKNATAAYTAVRKPNVATDISAINWALGMTITAGLGMTLVRHARRTPPVPPGLDAMRWRKLLHNVHSWLHQKLKSNDDLRQELEEARRLLLDRERQPGPVAPQSAMTEDDIVDFNDVQAYTIELSENLSKVQAEVASLRQELEASASQDVLDQIQAELAALRQELQARDRADADLEELKRLRDELAAAKTVASGNEGKLNQVREEVAGLRNEVEQHEELQQLQDEELKEARRVQEDLQERLDQDIKDRKVAEEQLARNKAPSLWARFVGGTPKAGSKASPFPVPPSSPLPSLPPLFVFENGQDRLFFSPGSKDHPPSSPASTPESSQPTPDSRKLAVKKDAPFTPGPQGPPPSSPPPGFDKPAPDVSELAANEDICSQAMSTPTTNQTPSSNRAKGKRPACIASLEEKWDALKRLTSSALASTASTCAKRSRDFDDVQGTPIPFKKSRLTRQSNLRAGVFTPGGRPSIKLAMPDMRPAEVVPEHRPSSDQAMSNSGNKDEVVGAVEDKAPAVDTPDDTVLPEQSVVVPVELQQDPVGDVEMADSDGEADVPSSFVLAGSESPTQPQEASATVDEPPASDIVMANDTQQDESAIVIKTEPEDSSLDLEEVPVKAETSISNSSIDVDMVDSVQDQTTVEAAVAPPSPAPNNRRRSFLPVPVPVPASVRRSTRIAGTTKDLSEKALQERASSPRKTTTTRSRAGSQPPPSSKPKGVAKTPARQTRSVSPQKMSAVKSAAGAASPRKRK